MASLKLLQNVAHDRTSSTIIEGWPIVILSAVHTIPDTNFGKFSYSFMFTSAAFPRVTSPTSPLPHPFGSFFISTLSVLNISCKQKPLVAVAH